MKVFLIVLDSVGIGAMPDAENYGDSGANTLRSAVLAGANLPNLKKMGLFNIDGVGFDKEPNPNASFARLAELSKGKDTTIGHWEIAGVISTVPLPVFPEGFPEDFIARFEKIIGRKVVCNKPYSGTKVIEDYGQEHVKTGNIIVYTSADSVFQVAANESIITIEELYKICDIARELLTGDLGVGRVIARPFEGEYPNFKRTSRRHDISLSPPQRTLLDKVKENGKQVIAVGKISDIFADCGITQSIKTSNNTDGLQKTSLLLEKDFDGLAFINLVDFDMLYGHRNDSVGYANALVEFDSWIGNFANQLKQDDLLIITADHGCDPQHSGTDHTREYVPLILFGKQVKHNCNLATLQGFDHIADTVIDWLSIEEKSKKSLKGQIKI